MGMTQSASIICLRVGWRGIQLHARAVVQSNDNSVFPSPRPLRVRYRILAGHRRESVQRRCQDNVLNSERHGSQDYTTQLIGLVDYRRTARWALIHCLLLRLPASEYLPCRSGASCQPDSYPSSIGCSSRASSGWAMLLLMAGLIEV